MEVFLESLWFVLSLWGDSVTNQVPSIELELAAAASPQDTLFVIVHIFQKFPQSIQSSLKFSKIIAPQKHTFCHCPIFFKILPKLLEFSNTF